MHMIEAYADKINSILCHIIFANTAAQIYFICTVLLTSKSSKYKIVTLPYFNSTVYTEVFFFFFLNDFMTFRILK